jgi:hypothetical protein
VALVNWSRDTVFLATSEAWSQTCPLWPLSIIATIDSAYFTSTWSCFWIAARCSGVNCCAAGFCWVCAGLSWAPATPAKPINKAQASRRAIMGSLHRGGKGLLKLA